MADRVWGPFLRSLLLVTQHGAPYTMRTVVEDIESIGGSGGAAVVAALPLLTSTFAMATLLWLSLAAFAVLGGADFGAGVWDFFSFGRRAGREQGALIRAIGTSSPLAGGQDGSRARSSGRLDRSGRRTRSG